MHVDGVFGVQGSGSKGVVTAVAANVNGLLGASFVAKAEIEGKDGLVRYGPLGGVVLQDHLPPCMHMYVCMYLRTYVRLYVCIYVCMHARACACVCVCACMCVRMHACMHACMYVGMHVRMHVR